MTGDQAAARYLSPADVYRHRRMGSAGWHRAAVSRLEGGAMRAHDAARLAFRHPAGDCAEPPEHRQDCPFSKTCRADMQGNAWLLLHLPANVQPLTSGSAMQSTAAKLAPGLAQNVAGLLHASPDRLVMA